MEKKNGHGMLSKIGYKRMTVEDLFLDIFIYIYLCCSCVS